MTLTAENYITMLVALIAGLPGLVTLVITYRRNAKSKRVDMVEVYVELLSITSRFDLLIQKILVNHPEVNGELRKEWMEASTRLKALREQTKL